MLGSVDTCWGDSRQSVTGVGCAGIEDSWRGGEQRGGYLNHTWRRGRLLEATRPPLLFEVLLADSFVSADVAWKRAQLCEGRERLTAWHTVTPESGSSTGAQGHEVRLGWRQGQSQTLEHMGNFNFTGKGVPPHPVPEKRCLRGPLAAAFAFVSDSA